MEIIFIKLDTKTTLYKSLDRHKILNWDKYLELHLSEVPRIGESIIIPSTEKTKPYLKNRNNPPIIRVKDIIIQYVADNKRLYYLKCEYILDKHNWMS